MTFRIFLLGATFLTAGCSDPLPVANNTTAVAVNGTEEVMPSEGDALPVDNNAATKTEADYTGRWTGVEGMYLNITPRPAGGLALDMQWDLDNRGTFEGTVTPQGLRFMRGGVAETAVPSDGEATGLKYLAGKSDCLTVKPGEGYCRD